MDGSYDLTCDWSLRRSVGGSCGALRRRGGAYGRLMGVSRYRFQYEAARRKVNRLFCFARAVMLTAPGYSSIHSANGNKNYSHPKPGKVKSCLGLVTRRHRAAKPVVVRVYKK